MNSKPVRIIPDQHSGLRYGQRVLGPLKPDYVLYDKGEASYRHLSASEIPSALVYSSNLIISTNVRFYHRLHKITVCSMQ